MALNKRPYLAVSIETLFHAAWHPLRNIGPMIAHAGSERAPATSDQKGTCDNASPFLFG